MEQKFSYVNQSIALIGDWDFIWSDPDGNEIKRETVKNLITQSGLNFLASLLIAETTNDVPFYLALGTGSTAAASTDTALQVETFRKLIAAKSRQANMVRLRGFFLNTEANGDFAEFGVFAAGTQLTGSGTLINRLVTPISKADNQVLTIECRLTIAAG